MCDHRVIFTLAVAVSEKVFEISYCSKACMNSYCSTQRQGYMISQQSQMVFYYYHNIPIDGYIIPPVCCQCNNISGNCINSGN